ncbi:MAG: hypothetical protein U0792_09530 [Gemmataceae bacterium]
MLQKIAEVEKIEIDEDDLDHEIERIADRSGESVRRVRARMEKEDLAEALATDLLEQKALDLILQNATYEDYEWNAEESRGDEVSTVEADAMPESSTPTEAPTEEKPAS